MAEVLQHSQENEDSGYSRRDEIVEAARNLYETKGLNRTTVKDITEEVGVTRSLFYHYFENKDAVTEAVLDDYVHDFIQLVYFWNESRERYQVRKAVHDCVKMLRRGVFDKDSFRQDIVHSENAGLYLRFSSRAAESLAHYITDTTGVEYAQFHEIEIDHVYEMFYMLICGLVGFVRHYPDAPDELLEDLIIQTLHLDVDSENASVATLAPEEAAAERDAENTDNAAQPVRSENTGDVA